MEGIKATDLLPFYSNKFYENLLNLIDEKYMRLKTDVIRIAIVVLNEA